MCIIYNSRIWLFIWAFLTFQALWGTEDKTVDPLVAKQNNYFLK